MKCFEQSFEDEQLIQSRNNTIIRITDIINALTNDDMTKYITYYAKAQYLTKFSKELKKIEKVVYKLK